MQFLTSLFGGSGNALVTTVFALAIVLVLIVLGLWGLKFISRVSAGMGRGRNRRLHVIDTVAVDTRRRLVIIRRDNVEHLLLTGGPQDLVIETGIAVDRPTLPRRNPARPGEAPAEKPPEREPRRPFGPRPATKVAAAPAAVPAAAQPATPVTVTPGSTVEALREIGRPAVQRPPFSLRHTGLMRPSSRGEPVRPAHAPENAEAASPDSAKRQS
ncbi:MAG: FliO/MopB family protein [Devosia sp.]